MSSKTSFTAYELSRVINELLAEDGLAPVKSQQIYNATQRIRDRVGNDIPTEIAAEFVAQYVENRKAGRSVRASVSELRGALGV